MNKMSLNRGLLAFSCVLLCALENTSFADQSVTSTTEPSLSGTTGNASIVLGDNTLSSDGSIELENVRVLPDFSLQSEQQSRSVVAILGEDWSIEVPPNTLIDSIDTQSVDAHSPTLEAGLMPEPSPVLGGVSPSAPQESGTGAAAGVTLFSHIPEHDKTSVRVGMPEQKLFFDIRNNAPTLFEGLPDILAQSGPRTRFTRMCNTVLPGIDLHPDTEFAYKVKNNFYIYYNFCGERAITEQLTTKDKHSNIIAAENIDFSYKYPDGSLALIRKCLRYDENCAPTHVQMIAADLVYARFGFRSVGFKTPAGGMTSGAPEIPVHLTQSTDASTAHLGRIWLHEPLKGGGRHMRWLAFHEYFHLVQFAHRADRSFVQGLHNWSARPRDIVPWTAPSQRLEMSSFFWGNLESMASWAANVLISNYPTYDRSGNAWNDGRGYPFFSSYADLVYGYMAERFSRSAGGGFCNGCDAMVEFVHDFLDPDNEAQRGDAFKWAKTEYLEKYLTSNGTSLAKFIEDFHRDLIYSLYVESPEGGTPFRFANRNSPNRTEWDWPPKLTQLPDTKEEIGICDDTAAALSITKAKQLPGVGAGKVMSYTCTFRMAPAGALHLRLPIPITDVPGKVSVSARAVEISGNQAPAAPQIIMIPTAAGKNAGRDYNDLKAISGAIYSAPDVDHLLTSKLATASYGISRADKRDGLNYVFLIVRYPDFWQRFRAIAQDSPNVNVPEAPYIENPINMQVEIKAVW